MTASGFELVGVRPRTATDSTSRILGLPWPLAGFIALQLVGWTLLPSLLTTSMHASTAEIVMWGREFYWVNYKHPALTSWVMDVAYALFGVHLWVVYFVGQVFVASTYVFVYLLGRDLLDEPRATVAPLLLAGLTYVTEFSVKFNHNLVQLPFWAAFAWFLWRAADRGKARWWLLAAATAALGIYGKFSTGLPIALGCGWILADPRTRAQLRRWQPYAGLALFLAMMAPLVYELWRTHFLTLQWITQESDNKGASWHSYLKHQGEYLLRVLVVAVAAGAVGFRRADPETAPGNTDRRKLAYLLLMGMGPLLATFVMVPFMSLRNAWSVPMFSFAGLALLGVWPRAVVRRAGWRAFGVAVLVSAFMATQVAHYLERGRASTLPGQFHYPAVKIAHQITKDWHQRLHRPLKIIGGNSFVATLVGIDSPDRPAMFSDLNPVESPTMTPERIARDGMLIVWQVGGWKPPQLAKWIAGRPVTIKEFRWSKRPDAKPVRIAYVIIPPQG